VVGAIREITAQLNPTKHGNLSMNKSDKKKSKNGKLSNKPEANEEVFSPKVEKLYKIILRIMSWTVGTSLILVIVLFYFNSPVVDQFSQIIFYIGILTLIVFGIIELVSIHVKRILAKYVNE
jgi:hypothetical protein